MGLADRFKESLEKRDIFQKNVSGGQLTQESLYSSNPIVNEVSIQTQKLHTDIAHNPFESLMEAKKNQMPLDHESKKFEDLETEIINKIRKTPYWNEYSKNEQSNMVGAYFNKKIQSLKYNHIKLLPNDKENFIKNIVALTNFR